MSATTNPPGREGPTVVMGSLLGGAMLMEYRIEHVLGKPGGFGITYLATDTNLEKKVAVKEYLPTDFAMRSEGASVSIRSIDDKDAFEWGMKGFLNEARTLARYKHPNVVQVHRLFEANHTAYIVMEYVEGDTLSEALKRKSGLNEIELKQVLLPISDGLETVHKSGVLHRDIKPHNIILRQDGTPVLIDFGAARNSLGSKTRSIISILTAGYAPIEQYSEVGDQGPWTDIYALAAVAYSAISGKTPPDAINRLSNDPLKPAVVIGEGRYSRQFLEAVDWALRMKREDRPQNLAEWREALTGRQPVPKPDGKAGGMVIEAVDLDLTSAPVAAAPPPKPVEPPKLATPSLDMMQTIIKPMAGLMETQDVTSGRMPKAAAPAAQPPLMDEERTTITPKRSFLPPPAKIPATPSLDDASMKTTLGASPSKQPRPAAPDTEATIIKPIAKAAPKAAPPKAPLAEPAKVSAAASSAGSKKWVPLAAGGVAVLIVIVLAGLIWGGGSKSSPKPIVETPASEVTSTTDATPPGNPAPASDLSTASGPANSPASLTAPTSPAGTASTPSSTASTAGEFSTAGSAPAAQPPAPSNPSTTISTIPENASVPGTPVAAAATPPKQLAAAAPVPKPVKPAVDPKAVKPPVEAATAHNDLAPKMLQQVQGNWSARVKQPSVALDGGCSVAAYRTWKLEISGISSDQSEITGRYSLDVNAKANSGCSAPEFNVSSAGTFLGKPLTANQLRLTLANGPCTGDCPAAGKLLTRGNAASNAQLVMIGDKVISISIIDNGLNYVFTNH